MENDRSNAFLTVEGDVYYCSHFHTACDSPARRERVCGAFIDFDICSIEKITIAIYSFSTSESVGIEAARSLTTSVLSAPQPEIE